MKGVTNSISACVLIDNNWHSRDVTPFSMFYGRFVFFFFFSTSQKLWNFTVYTNVMCTSETLLYLYPSTELHRIWLMYKIIFELVLQHRLQKLRRLWSGNHGPSVAISHIYFNFTPAYQEVVSYTLHCPGMWLIIKPVMLTLHKCH